MCAVFCPGLSDKRPFGLTTKWKVGQGVLLEVSHR